MRRTILGIAAIALATSPAFAQGNGKGGGQGNDQAAQGGGSGKAPAAAKGGNGGGNGNSGANTPQQRAQAGPAKGAARAQSDRGNSGASPGRSDQGNQSLARGNSGNSSNAGGGKANGDGAGNTVRIASRTYDWSDRRNYGGDTRGLINGCPPGLAKKANGCNPPGQVRESGWLYAASQPRWWGYGDRDGRYFYRDGYLLRLLDGGRIGGFLPLLGGALAVGNRWPDSYGSVNLPPYLSSYYGLDPQGYRYADNALYGYDPQTQAITSIAALLTGDDFSVGRPLPSGYDVYNVPYDWRSRYADGPDAHYRYSDGYIYQVDPETKLVAAAIELLAS